MFWYALSVLLCPLYVLVGRLRGDDRDRLILVLRQQVLILQLWAIRPASRRGRRQTRPRGVRAQPQAQSARRVSCAMSRCPVRFGWTGSGQKVSGGR